MISSELGIDSLPVSQIINPQVSIFSCCLGLLNFAKPIFIPFTRKILINEFGTFSIPKSVLCKSIIQGNLWRTVEYGFGGIIIWGSDQATVALRFRIKKFYSQFWFSIFKSLKDWTIFHVQINQIRLALDIASFITDCQQWQNVFSSAILVGNLQLHKEWGVFNPFCSNVLLEPFSLEDLSKLSLTKAHRKS